MLNISHSKKGSANHKPSNTSKKRKLRSQKDKTPETENVQLLSTEEEGKQSEMQFVSYIKENQRSNPTIEYKIEEEIITGDKDSSVLDEIAIKDEGESTNKFAQIEGNRNLVLIKEDHGDGFLNEQDTKDDWLNSIAFYFDSQTGKQFSKCPACDCVFFKIRNLKEHLLTHTYTNQNQIICLFCLFTTENFNELPPHLRKHGNQCQVCNQNLSKRKLFDKHLEEAEIMYKVKRDNIGNFVCTGCHLSFDLKHQLQKHWFKHSCKENKTYQCNPCSAIFDTVEHLKNHKCLKCPVCEKVYSNFPHLRSHTRFKKHFLNCYICSYEFSLRIDYDRHLELHQQKFKPHEKFMYCLHGEDNTTLQCETCNKLFHTNPSFVSHVFHEHNINVTENVDSDNEDSPQPVGSAKLTDDIIFEDVKIEVPSQDTFDETEDFEEVLEESGEAEYLEEVLEEYAETEYLEEVLDESGEAEYLEEALVETGGTECYKEILKKKDKTKSKHSRWKYSKN